MLSARTVTYPRRCACVHTDEGPPRAGPLTSFVLVSHRCSDPQHSANGYFLQFGFRFCRRPFPAPRCICIDTLVSQRLRRVPLIKRVEGVLVGRPQAAGPHGKTRERSFRQQLPFGCCLAVDGLTPRLDTFGCHSTLRFVTLPSILAFTFVLNGFAEEQRDALQSGIV